MPPPPPCQPEGTTSRRPLYGLALSGNALVAATVRLKTRGGVSAQESERRLGLRCFASGWVERRGGWWGEGEQSGELRDGVSWGQGVGEHMR